jgi:hypothetical protein
MLTALVTMDEKNQNHHDAHCPRCRRANSISRQRMELFFPNWREAAKQMASMPVAEAVPASASTKTEPLPKSVKSAAVKTATTKKTTAAAAKSSSSKGATKPASEKKTSTSKTTAPAPSRTPKTQKPSSKTKKK